MFKVANLHKKLENLLIVTPESGAKRISWSNFSMIIRHARRQNQMGVYSEALHTLMREGFLSQQKQGNFGVYSNLSPNFFIGPQLGIQRLYFPSIDDANLYEKMFSTKVKRTSATLGYIKKEE